MKKTDYSSEIGKRIRLVRRSKGISQDYLGKFLCPDNPLSGRSRIAQYEAGTRSINSEAISVICKSLCISSDYLLGIKENDIRVDREKTELVRQKAFLNSLILQIKGEISRIDKLIASYGE